MTTYREDGALYREDGSRILADDPRPVAPPVIARRRRGGGGFLIGVLLILGIIVAVLFYTGFWSVDVTQQGAMPRISVNTTPGVMPKVDLQSKKIVISSKQETVAVPTVGVKNAKDDSN